jgi:hypothetical protein
VCGLNVPGTFSSLLPSLLRVPAGKGSQDNINLFSLITIVSFFILAPVALLTDGLVFTPAAMAAAGILDTQLVMKRALLSAICFHAYQQVGRGGVAWDQGVRVGRYMVLCGVELAGDQVAWARSCRHSHLLLHLNTCSMPLASHLPFPFHDD